MERLENGGELDPGIMNYSIHIVKINYFVVCPNQINIKDIAELEKPS